MKKILTVMITLCCTMQLHLASAQSAELQQLALDIEKLAQFKQILADMKNGYQVIDNGYSSIKNISQGNYNLHQGFLDGLLIVSPALAKYKRVADIISYQTQMVSEYKSAFGRFKTGGLFTASEIDYMGKVYSNLFDQSSEQMDELTMVVTSGKLRMSDDERITAINRIYDDMQGKLSFLRSFNTRTGILENQRKTALKEAQLQRQINGN